MTRKLLQALLFLLLFGKPTLAQPGEGSLVGYITDEQGGALPGVTVTATSPMLIGQRLALSDAAGYYRLVSLPPGDYTVKAELQGFSLYRREAILMRAGATFAVDVVMKVGSLAETITVAGDSPMLEVGKPSNIITVQGEFQRSVPLSGRRNWSDFLELTPSVHVRLSDEGSGRPVYYGLASELFAHVIQFEGAIAASYADYQARDLSISGEGMADVQIKSGGVDAASPMSTGLVINVVAPSGGNTPKGSASYSYQPLTWNGNNLTGPANVNATPTIQRVNQFDLAFGGPIAHDKAWYFGSFRYSDLLNGISRSQRNVDLLRAFRPNVELFNNQSVSYQPFIKLTSQLSAVHQVTAFYQFDRTYPETNTETNADKISQTQRGGGLVSGKLTSAWSNKLLTTLQASWNNKTAGAGLKLEGLTGPQIVFHQNAIASSGTLVGNGALVAAGNVQSRTRGPAEVLMLRGDATFYQAGWGGSHELQAGFFAAPRYRYDTYTEYVNDGFILEERRQIDQANPSAGTVPFHRRFVDQPSLQIRAARDSDFGVYVQDSWKPGQRLTVNAGVRVDRVKRHDDIFNVDRETATAIGPRFGFSYLVTRDAKNVLRFSAGRVHEQVSGRDAPTSTASTSKVGQTDTYDLNADGVFETSIATPAVTASLAGFEFDPNLRQPFVDEFIVGYRKQLPWQLGLDIAAVRRYYRDIYALVDVNGRYPSGANQPFLGFGLVDPSRGILNQQTNNTWNDTVYTALDITVAKNMSHRFQILGGVHRQWQHLDGTWNPTDPARFIQPGAFADDKGIWGTRGNGDQNSLSSILGFGVSEWPPFRVGIAGTYQAPWHVVAALSYSVQAGEWSGPILDRIALPDPALGPARVTVAGGGTQPNPLATTTRFAFATRGEGQERVPAIRFLNLKAGRELTFGPRKLEIAVNVFNVFNEGRYYQYTFNGADTKFSANYLVERNLQSARAAQLMLSMKF